KFVNDWLTRVQNSGQVPNVRSTPLGELGTRIGDYHALDKTVYKNLGKRKDKLKDIAKKAAAVMKQMNISEATAKHRFTEAKYPNIKPESQHLQVMLVKYEKQSIGRTLLTIEHRALRKAGYLKLLKKYYSSGQSRDVNAFKRMLGKAQDGTQ